MSETMLMHETGCYGVCGPDILLQFHFPPLYLPLHLGEERVVWPEVLQLDASHLLLLHGHFALPNAALESKAYAAKWLLGSEKQEQNPPEALYLFSAMSAALNGEKLKKDIPASRFQMSEPRLSGFSSSWRVNHSCPERQWLNRGHGTSRAEQHSMSSPARNDGEVRALPSKHLLDGQVKGRCRTVAVMFSLWILSLWMCGKPSSRKTLLSSLEPSAALSICIGAHQEHSKE